MIGNHKIILIAAVDKNWAIGKDNKLLYKIPLDMKYFKTMTEGNIVVYGYNTLLSFPQRKILPNRVNIILTSKHIECSYDDMYVAHSIDEVLEIISNINDRRDVYICGGASVYRQFLDLADSAFITKIHAKSEDADAFFPNLDKDSHWDQTHHYLPFKDKISGLKIEFANYVNNK